MGTKVVALMFLGVSSCTFAASANHSVKLGIYASSITYKEPSVMTEKGMMTGLKGQLSLHNNGQAILLDLMYSEGDMDYDGSGKLTNIPDSILEVRGMLGRDLYLQSGYRVTPYIGLGYRNLNDNSKDMITTTNRVGYEREQVYWYSPLGIEIQNGTLNGSWRLGARLEYDYFIAGRNHTYLSSVPGNNDLHLKQNRGSGYRMSVDFTRALSSITAVTIQPFYKYWNVKQSDTGRSGGKVYVEPDNNSTEWGVGLLLSF
ncbi:hypothetical protein MSP8887_03382 [Marinomonas spartinae]|uniref:Outer membrane protein beta-barrel domain-containing protein n=1 Tax=Marinomonas spartinae TaxID=1792290 RepID=A0A1A8T9E1_9GAMM|nr:hypothetical protein [Marinomonas spartinae]SBS29344.1 hypothetical protein MSP8886_01521 [Marinomonas spartinae]SBS38594.1 hypothetical protein MSP8887_03382 [Marinomonas spartinae]